MNTITEKEKLLNIRNDEISVLKQRLDSLNEKGIIIIIIIIIIILIFFNLFFFSCLENELEALKRVSVEQDELLAKNKIELEVMLSLLSLSSLSSSLSLSSFQSLQSTSEELKQQNDSLNTLFEVNYQSIDQIFTITTIILEPEETVGAVGRNGQRVF